MSIGTCPFGQNCRAVWSNSDGLSYAVYPQSLLPGNDTTWHIFMSGSYPAAPLISGGSDFGIPFGGGILPGGGGFSPFGPGPTGNSQATTSLSIIFAKIAYRLNVPHVLTQEEVETGIIDLGEFVWDVVGVTDNPFNEEILTEQELDSVNANPDFSVEDREFEKLFNMDLENSVFGPGAATRFNNIEPNREGVFYRLDDGGFKGNQVFPDPDFFGSFGQGTTPSSVFRDGSSKKINLNMIKVITIDVSTGDPDGPWEPKPFQEGGADDNLLSLQVQARKPLGTILAGDGTVIQQGDTIYLTYLAIKEHYTRQVIIINWVIIGGQGACGATPGKVRGGNFRFYEWSIPNSETGVSERVSGWRAVEAFDSATNIVAPVGDLFNPDSIELADFPIGGSGGAGGYKYFSAGARQTDGKTKLSSIQDVRKFAVDGDELPGDVISLDTNFPGSSYHTNSGIAGNNTSFRLTDWFIRKEFSVFGDYHDSDQHVFFNVHPKALFKRDVDKWAINRFLAVEIERDIKAGKNSIFPFMDESDLDATNKRPPTGPLGARSGMDSSNAIFEPFDPLQIPSSPASSCDMSLDSMEAQFAFGGQFLRERFAKDTKILVQRFKHEGASGAISRLILIEGKASPQATAITCILDPSKAYSFVMHIGSSGFVVFNHFTNGFINAGMRELPYRPDQGNPPIADNQNPTPDQFEKKLGYSGMFGDRPGYKEGKIISSSFYTEKVNVSKKVFGIVTEEEESSTVDEIEFELDGEKLSINVGDGFYGSTEIKYKYKGKVSTDSGGNSFIEPFDIIFILRDGTDINDLVDSITVAPIPEKVNILTIPHKWMQGDRIDIIGSKMNESDIEIISIEVTALSELVAADFIGELEGPLLSNPLTGNKFKEFFRNNGVFFESDVVSLGESDNSNLYAFFNDTNDGISVAVSQDLGRVWHYHYGIVESIDESPVRHPFVVNDRLKNKCFLFFLHRGKVFCKPINYAMFHLRDAFIIERFKDDIFEEGDEGSPDGPAGKLPNEKESVYSPEGIKLRREIISWVAAGDLSDEDFLVMIGKDEEDESEDLQPFEERTVQPSGDIKVVRKFPVARAPMTAFPNHDVDNLFFSVYRRDNGEMRLCFLGPTGDDGDLQLQCHFSNDDGVTWYDLWEYIEFAFNRFKADPDSKTQFIDRESTGAKPELPLGIIKEDPGISTQNAAFGINIHWSRLKRHKKAGEGEDETELTIESESETLGVSAPYVYYQPTSKKVYLFYIYESCLLCKILDDYIFQRSANTRTDKPDEQPEDADPVDMNAVKDFVERKTKAHFIDGNLEDTDLREEVQDFVNEDLNEKMAAGNIIFPHVFAIDTFDETRTIASQRPCAYELPNGNVRIMYKHAETGDLRAAIWTGTIWNVEDLMKDVPACDDNCDAGEVCIGGVCVPDRPKNLKSVIGGFGDDKFGETSTGGSGGSGDSDDSDDDSDAGGGDGGVGGGLGGGG